MLLNYKSKAPRGKLGLSKVECPSFNKVQPRTQASDSQVIYRKNW